MYAVGIPLFSSMLNNKHDRPVLFEDIIYKKHVMTPTPGFSAANSQVYIKSGMSFTVAHSELGYSSAFNYLHNNSSGTIIYHSFIHSFNQSINYSYIH